MDWAPDTVLYGARVLTLEPARLRAQALAPWQGRVAAAGDDAGVLATMVGGRATHDPEGLLG